MLRWSFCILIVLGFSDAARALAQTPLPLFPTQQHAAGDAPSGVVAADVDQDGRMDLVVSNADSDDVSVLLGNGLGCFAPTAQFAVGTSPRGIAVGDLNGDSHLDVATANYASTNVTLLFGDGLGGFVAGGAEPIIGNGTAIALADVDQNGHLDLLVTARSPNNLVVLLGVGGGAFAAASYYPVGPVPNALGVGFVDGDALLDVVTANSGGSSVSLLRGAPGGTFLGATPIAVGALPHGIVLADFDGDAKLDFATANEGSQDVTVRLGDGGGAFGPPASFPLGATNFPSSVDAGDLDGDGAVDLVVGGQGLELLATLHGDGHGGFAAAVVYGDGMHVSSVAIADFNGDARPDVAATQTFDDAVSVWRNAGSGTFATDIFVDFASQTLAVGDLNGDGLQDFVAGDAGAYRLRVYLGTASGLIGAPLLVPLSNWPWDVALGDFDGDNDLDVVVSRWNTFVAGSILLGDGQGGFGAESAFTLGGHGRLAVGDLDGDSHLDVVSVNGGSMQWRLGDGLGGFGTVHSQAVGFQNADVTLGDWNGDLWLDAAIADDGGNSSAILLADGLGGFLSPTWIAIGNAQSGIASGDVNSDGHLDLAVSVENVDAAVVMLGDGQGGFAPPSAVPVGNQPERVALADIDGDGRLDVLTASKSISIALGDGAGGFAPSFQVVGGAAEFSIGEFDGRGGLDIAIVGGQFRILPNAPEVPDPTHYCTAKPNSLGCTPALSWSGTASASEPSGFVLGATNLLSNKTGLLFFGTSGPFAAPLQGGTLCVRPPIVRTALQNSAGNPPPLDCSGSYAFDFNAHVASGATPALGAGIGVNVQFWSRDPGYSPPGNVGLTAGVHFVIGP